MTSNERGGGEGDLSLCMTNNDEECMKKHDKGKGHKCQRNQNYLIYGRPLDQLRKHKFSY